MPTLMEFKNVSCANGSIEPLENISFTMNSGENAVIFAVEGSGLQTITPLMLDLQEQYEGDILYKGNSIRGLDYLGRLQYKNEIGYLHGDYGLLSNLSVEQNISLRLEYYSEYSSSEIATMVKGLMRELGIYDRRETRPVNLSRSQILRTAYARAVAHDPDLLIIEHAMDNQSPINTRSFMDVLKRRAARPDKSVIFVTYEPQKFVDFADIIYMLYKGTIVFNGNRREFMESDNPYLVQFRDAALQGPMEID